MKKIPLIFSVFLLFISCCEEPIPGDLYPMIHSISFFQKTAKVGDTIAMYIYRDGFFDRDFDYDKNFTVEKGKLKYIGPIREGFPDEESRFMESGNITRIVVSDRDENTDYVEVTEYISIKQLFYYPKEEREVVRVEFKVPEGAKSGYIWTTGPFNFMGQLTSSFSDEKLTIVDADGNEIK